MILNLLKRAWTMEVTHQTLLMFLLFSHPIMSDSSQPHEPQHARPTCPSPLLEFAQVYVHCIGDASQPLHLLMSLLLNDWANLQNCLFWIKKYKQNKLCDSFYPTAAHLIRLYTYFSRKYWKLIQWIHHVKVPKFLSVY